MPIKYIGRKTDFLGKPLWEILGNLKDHGVGRIVLRNAFRRYPEISYMKILKVAPYNYDEDTNPIESPRKVVAIVDRVFRGEKIGTVFLRMTSYKPDYILVPKEEEHIYLNAPLMEKKKQVLPRYMEFPPLLKEYIKQKAKQLQDKEIPDPQLQIDYNECRIMKYRVAEEGETPDVTFDIGLGKPVSPGLFANIRYPHSEADSSQNNSQNITSDAKEDVK